MRCVSLDCLWLFQRKKVEQQAEDIEQLQELILALDLGDNAMHEKRDGSDEQLHEDDYEGSWDEMGEDEK